MGLDGEEVWMSLLGADSWFNGNTPVSFGLNLSLTAQTVLWFLHISVRPCSGVSSRTEHLFQQQDALWDTCRHVGADTRRTMSQVLCYCENKRNVHVCWQVDVDSGRMDDARTEGLMYNRAAYEQDKAQAFRAGQSRLMLNIFYSLEETEQFDSTSQKQIRVRGLVLGG